MTKSEFISRLEYRLSGIPEVERKEAIQYYLNNPSNIRKEGLQSSMMVEPYTPVSVMGHLMTIYNQLLDK